MTRLPTSYFGQLIMTEVMRWMPPFVRHRKMLIGASVAHEGGSDGRSIYAGN